VTATDLDVNKPADTTPQANTVSEPKSLGQIVYASAASGEFELSDIEPILEVARRRNSQLGVTGMLLFEKTSFLQVLEGDQEVIDALLERIRRDRRHTRVVLLLREPIEARTFGKWSMGGSNVSLRELREAIGSADWFEAIDSFSGLSDEKVRRILELFRSGSFRQRLT
jgi:hypothetical protein